MIGLLYRFVGKPDPKIDDPDLVRFDRSAPRGVRNNNPLNIRKSKSNVWVGEIENGSDPEFEQFKSPEFGIRAGAYLILKFYKRQKINTISKLIRKWAPETENDTQAYIRAVCKMTSIGPDEVVDFSDYDVLSKVIKAMIYVECGGYKYSDRVIDKGLELVGIIPNKFDILRSKSGRTAAGLGLSGIAALSVNDLIELYSSVEWIQKYDGIIAITMFCIAIAVALFLIRKSAITSSR